MKLSQHISLSMFCLVLISVIAFPAVAEETTAGGVNVIDSQGFTRAALDLGSGENASLTVEVVGAGGVSAAGTTVTLASATGETLTAVVAANGVATFEGIAAGSWTIASAAPGVTFVSTSLAPVAAGAAVGASAAAVGAGVVGVGGATTLAVQEANNSGGSSATPTPASDDDDDTTGGSDDDDDATTSPTETPAPTATPAPSTGDDDDDDDELSPSS